MREYAERVAELCGDYRQDDGVTVDADRAMEWVEQFPEIDRAFVLRETAHLLTRTYLCSNTLCERIEDFVRRFRAEICGARWLRHQSGGSSQAWLLGELEERGLNDTPAANTALYLDDVVFSGGRASKDILACLHNGLLRNVRSLGVYSLIRHRASWAALENRQSDLRAALAETGIGLRLEQLRTVLDGKFDTDQSSEVLRPIALPDAGPYAEYVGTLKNFEARTPGNPQRSVFSSDIARQRYERVMFSAGCEVRAKCPYLGEKVVMKPLGATTFYTPGFGALTVTARNCPNNTPLAWWAGSPWVPLFPRRTNVGQAQTVTVDEEFGWSEVDI